MYNNNTMTNLLISDINTKTKSEPKITNKTCAHALAESLQELGVDTIFGYPGASIISVYNELSFVKNIKHNFFYKL